MSHIVVIGAGQAGSSLTVKLRALGFEGEITLIGDEPHIPYQRPPLSKAYLMGEMSFDRLALRPAAFYEDQRITLMTGNRVTAIDRKAKQITTDTGPIAYDQLAFTTGATPRRLPAAMGGHLPGVHVVRDLADVDRLGPDMTAGKRALIIGGGYIGLEAAAVARKRGVDVTLIEAAPRILGRVAAPETADYFRALHSLHGVKILENTALKSLRGDKQVTGVILADGTTLDADFVITGVGVTANADLAAAAGLPADPAIAVNALGQTEDPAIWAAGDCAIFPYRDQPTRLESVQNAIDQAEAIAANMLGAATPYVPKPWFWSDQYDVKLQIAGLNTGYDQTHIRPGDKPGTQSVWYYAGDTLLAVDAMNDPRAYMVGKRLIEAGRSPAPDAVTDPGTELKALLS